MVDSLQPHRKRIRHFHGPGNLHELTFSISRRKPRLTNNISRRWLTGSIDEVCEKEQCRLAAFAFMPEHVHRLILPESPDDKTISWFLSRVKRPVSARVKRALQIAGSHLLQSLTVRERPGKLVFRLWPEGPGYNRNLNEERTVLAAMNDLHENPVRRGLCLRAVDWKWSSARWYASDGRILDPDLPVLHGLPAGFFV